MSLEARLLRIASAVLRRPTAGPELFKRLVALSLLVAESNETDTDKQIEEAIARERADEPPIEKVDVSYDTEDEEEPEDEDTEGGYFPSGALPQKERRKGPRPEDVKPGRPDWWSSR